MAPRLALEFENIKVGMRELMTDVDALPIKVTVTELQ